MANETLRLGDFEFDPRKTAWTESWEETGGQEGRIVRVHGFLPSAAEGGGLRPVEALLEAASESDAASLSLRPGRRLWVMRLRFAQATRGPYTAYTLELEAANPFEEAEEETVLHWAPQVDGDTLALQNDGTAAAPLHITLEAGNEIAVPRFECGDRSIAYDGVLVPGHTLVLDGAEGRATLDGEDVTPYTTGLFPEARPGANTLTFTHESDPGNAALVSVRFRPRWY